MAAAGENRGKSCGCGAVRSGPHDHPAGLAQLRHCNQKGFPETAATSLTVSCGVDDRGYTIPPVIPEDIGSQRSSSRERIGHPECMVAGRSVRCGMA